MPIKRAKKAVKKVAAKGAKKSVRKAAAKRTKLGKTAKKVVKKVAKKTPPKPLPPRFDVRALDPARKCGPGTSVQLLYRIEESPAGPPYGSARTHLVFFDRHGWYCEHGRDCPAVPHAQREAKKFGFTARTAVAAPSPGPTQNGRMRA